MTSTSDKHGPHNPAYFTSLFYIAAFILRHLTDESRLVTGFIFSSHVCPLGVF